MSTRHSGIRYVTPAQRHDYLDRAIRQLASELYTRARENNPRRWSGGTRDWSHIKAVTLNPERKEMICAAMARQR